MSAAALHPDPCRGCGGEVRLSYSEPYRTQLAQRSLCFTCNHWENQAARTNETVIGGFLYSPGNRTAGPNRGMAGRRFDIEYFDGRRITTYDLWGGGEVPDAYRCRIPDTARFLDGAERSQVSETTCWNPSSDRSPPYPLPNGKSAPWRFGEMAARAIGNVAQMLNHLSNAKVTHAE